MVTIATSTLVLMYICNPLPIVATGVWLSRKGLECYEAMEVPAIYDHSKH